MAAPLLELRNITVVFGGVTALDGVTITVETGGIHGLIGPNGAGKSTLFNVACGLVQPKIGWVSLDGRDITRLGPHRRARLRMARTFQQLELFGVMSVYDNVLTAAEIRRGWARDRSNPARDAEEVLERTGLAYLRDERADGLSTGLARLLEVARALVTRPRLLLLDEPAAGLNEQETGALSTLLRGLGGDGLGIVLVEHDMDLVMQVSSCISVLSMGKLLTTATPEQVRADPAVISAYLGTAKAAAQ
ncbi:MAG TPA: ABC transporter ATP-binding protein [Jatrophihabitantaceae bacterium]|nr:ABC transporter ATP-binding protein [Jatrophihabitantaceae bacterium]